MESEELSSAELDAIRGLSETLKWYGEIGNWFDGYGIKIGSSALKDRGKRARNAYRKYYCDSESNAVNILIDAVRGYANPAIWERSEEEPKSIAMDETGAVARGALKSVKLMMEDPELYAMEKAFEEEITRGIVESKKWLEKTRPATVQDLADFLNIHLEMGGKITHNYNYDYASVEKHSNIVVATDDLVLTPLYGSASYTIIAPRGIKVNAHDAGHNHILRYGSKSNEFVPMYNDVKKLLTVSL